MTTNAATPDANPAADIELDARGLNCPLPILRSKKALSGMSSGQVRRSSSCEASATMAVR
jgi:tRNA 2-thiouridine synthesizing protein A